jgi:glycine/D-amino acid oxidase-like deaminating enzyme
MASSGFTVWAADIARTGWYGFPANAGGIVKIANHGPGRRVHPDAPRTTRPEDEAALRAFLRDSLPGLAEAPLVASKTCLYCDSFEFAVGIVRGLEGNVGPLNLANALETLGQVLFAPPSVKGWDGGPAWLNAQTLLFRQNLALALTSTEDARFGMS